MAQAALDERIGEIMQNPERAESMLYLMEKLPEITKTIQWVEEKAEFIQHVLQDKQSIGSVLGEAEEKLDRMNLTSEHLEAMLTLAQKLPSLVKLLEQVESIALFMKETITDKASLAYLAEGVSEVPAVKQGIDILQETNRRFNEETDIPNISLLRIYKLLKHPSLAKGFRYLETLLDVMHKQEKSN